MIHDEISNPKHYDLFPDGMQAIDVIEAALTPEEFAGYLKGNFLKYRLRAGEKGPAEKCLGKAEWYRDRLADHHDFMASDAITRAEHAKLKAEDESVKVEPTSGHARTDDELLASFEHHARRLTRWMHCMSGNDSYFGEPAGLVKSVAYDLNRLVGSLLADEPSRNPCQLGWSDETRRQDAAAEDEAWKAIEARMDVIGSNGNDGEHYVVGCATCHGRGRVQNHIGAMECPACHGCSSCEARP